MAYITKIQLQEILKNAPLGTTPQQLTRTLLNRGNIIEGLSNQPATNIPATETPPQESFGKQIFNTTLGREGYAAAPIQWAQEFLAPLKQRTSESVFKKSQEIMNNAVKFAQMAEKETDPTRKQHLQNLSQQSQKMAQEMSGTAEELIGEGKNALGDGTKIGAAKAVIGSVGQTGLALSNFATGGGGNIAAKLTSTAARRIATGAATSGLTSGAQSFFTEYKKSKDADKSFKAAMPAMITGALTGGLLTTAGETVKYLTRKLPLKQYRGIFRESVDDAMKEIKNTSIDDLKVNNPAKYKEYLNNGIISTDKAGTQKINESIARRALEENFSGNPFVLGTRAQKEIMETENKLISATKGKTSQLPGKQNYIDLLTDLKDKLPKEFGFGDKDKQIGLLIDGLNKTDGDVVETPVLLSLRRYLDSVRSTSSFNLNPTLSASQEIYKTAADNARNALNKTTGIGDLMSKYSDYIGMLKDLAKIVQKTNNNEAVDTFDKLLLAGGLLTGNVPAAAAVSVAIKGLRSVSAKTKIAQGLYKVGKITAPQSINVGNGITIQLPTSGITATAKRMVVESIKKILGQK